MHATLRGQRIWYERHGDAGSPVVLIMGFGISGRAWAPQLPALSASHRVVIYDNRGIGESETSQGAYGFADLADDTVALLDHLGFAQAHVVGVSMGGMISQHLALRHRQRVKSLTLIATFPGGSLLHALPRPRALSLFLRANTSRGAPRFAALRQLLYTDSYLARARPEEEFSGDTLEVFSVPGDTVTRLNQLRAVVRHDLTKSLPSLAVPTLIVKPEKDALVRPHNSDRLHRLIPRSRLLRYADAGHGVTHQCAAELNRELLEHFARVDAVVDATR